MVRYRLPPPDRADGGVYQQQVATSVGTAGTSLNISGAKAPKNGYVYVYVSNQSNQDVYFDNLMVSLAQGNIIEENHYYAFGLKIAAISSKKYADSYDGKVSNPYQYNSKEMVDEDADLNWYDYGFRNYDPQIGRFVQVDPLADNYPLLTQYQYAGNDPITNIDVDGLFVDNVVGGLAQAGEVIKEGGSMAAVIITTTRVVTGGAKATTTMNLIIKTAGIFMKAIKAVEIISNAASTPQKGIYPVYEVFTRKQVLQGLKEINFRKTLFKGGKHSVLEGYAAVLAEYEGLSLSMYDIDGPGSRNTTIGFGTLIHAGPIGNTPENIEKEKPFQNGITFAKALEFMVDEMRGLEREVNNYLKGMPLKRGQFAAILDLKYNVSTRKFKKFLKVFKEEGTEAAAQWLIEDGQELGGGHKYRRYFEAQLLLNNRLLTKQQAETEYKEKYEKGKK